MFYACLPSIRVLTQLVTFWCFKDEFVQLAAAYVVDVTAPYLSNKHFKAKKVLKQHLCVGTLLDFILYGVSSVPSRQTENLQANGRSICLQPTDSDVNN